MRITVIGLGHSGLVTAVGLAGAGHDVLGVDASEGRIRDLVAGRVPIYEPGLGPQLAAVTARGSLRFACGDRARGRMDLGDIAVICVGTPRAAGGGVDMSQVESAMGWIAGRGGEGLVVVMRSTVPPGSGVRMARRDLSALGIGYVANPEFLREGQALSDWLFPDRIVIGAEPGDERAAEAATEMYSGVGAPIVRTDITSAEMIKYAANALLATRISFINEIAMLCEQVGASIDDVSRAVAMDSRTGSPIAAGLGYGGSCLPKDVSALDHLARKGGMPLELLRSVMNVNARQGVLPIEALRGRFGGSLAGLSVGLLGLSFKPGTDDMRGAPALGLARGLVDHGVRVRAHDPRGGRAARMLLPPAVEVADSPEEAADGAQAVILVTEWDEIVGADWADISRRMLPPRFVFDGRNALDPGVIRSLGLEYRGVGRAVSPVGVGGANGRRRLLSNV